MKIISYDDILIDKNIALIREVIDADGVVIYPTDTLYGIGGNFFSPKVHQAIDTIKGRVSSPYSVMVPGTPMLEQLVETVPEVFYQQYEQKLPGKYTFLFKVSPKVNAALVKGSDKIGIRIPLVPNMLKLLEILNMPFISTSVNRSGERPLNNPDAIRAFIAQFASGVEPILLVDGGLLPSSKGSTILDLTQKTIKIIRTGDPENSKTTTS